MPSNSDILVTAIYGKDNPKYLHISQFLDSEVFYVSLMSPLIHNFLFSGRSTFAGNFSVGMGGLHLCHIRVKFCENLPTS